MNRVRPRAQVSRPKGQTVTDWDSQYLGDRLNVPWIIDKIYTAQQSPCGGQEITSGS